MIINFPLKVLTNVVSTYRSQLLLATSLPNNQAPNGEDKNMKYPPLKTGKISTFRVCVRKTDRRAHSVRIDKTSARQYFNALKYKSSYTSKVSVQKSEVSYTDQTRGVVKRVQLVDKAIKSCEGSYLRRIPQSKYIWQGCAQVTSSLIRIRELFSLTTPIKIVHTSGEAAQVTYLIRTAPGRAMNSQTSTRQSNIPTQCECRSCDPQLLSFIQIVL